jgi:nitrite reductase (NO-forming)
MNRNWAQGARLVLVLLLALFVVACGTGTPAADTPSTTDELVTPVATLLVPTVGPDEEVPAEGDVEGTGVDVAYTLRTEAANGGLMFVGVGGDIDGIENPTLTVRPGDTVEVTLVIGDTLMHDVVSPDVGLQSEQITGTENSTVATFTAPDEAGTYAYWCSVGNHRAQGMEGEIVVE